MAARNSEPAERGTAQNAPEGSTTKDDALDMGVPMLPGSAKEPVGPEDALGVGAKRGDYTDRVGPSNYQPHEIVVDDDGTGHVEPQRPRTADIGEVEGRKGGVDSADK